MTNERVYYSQEAEDQAMHDRTMLTLGFMTIGLGIGATLALLFAPSSGKKARKDLVKNVEDGLNSGRDAIEPMVKRLEEEFAELRKKVEERLA